MDFLEFVFSQNIINYEGVFKRKRSNGIMKYRIPLLSLSTLSSAGLLAPFLLVLSFSCTMSTIDFVPMQQPTIVNPYKPEMQHKMHTVIKIGSSTKHDNYSLCTHQRFCNFQSFIDIIYVMR